MNLKLTDGKEVCVSFSTADTHILFELRKFLMKNAIKFDWAEHPAKVFVPYTKEC